MSWLSLPENIKVSITWIAFPAEYKLSQSNIPQAVDILVEESGQVFNYLVLSFSDQILHYSQKGLRLSIKMYLDESLRAKSGI